LTEKPTLEWTGSDFQLPLGRIACAVVISKTFPFA
jgi:hypothetical protein